MGNSTSTFTDLNLPLPVPNTYGYVDSYNQNSDGTYACNLICQNIPDGNIAAQVYNYPSTYAPSVSNSTINLIGIVNSNNLVSPNSPLQMLIMSSDNKYIFFPNLDFSQKSIFNLYIAYYYYLVYTIKTHNINIPDMLIFKFFNMYYVKISKFVIINPDSTYDSIKDDGQKLFYGAYLLALNPPAGLTQNVYLATNKSKLQDVGYVYLTIYNYLSSSTKTSGRGLFPDNVCVQFNTPSVIPIAGDVDCRNIKDGTPIINPINILNIILIVVGVLCGLACLSCICCIFSSMFIFHKVKNRNQDLKI